MRKEYLSVPVVSLTTGAIFRMGILSNLALWGAFGLVIGLLGLAGYDAVKWNGEQIYGIAALVIGILISIIFALGGSFLFLIGGLFARWLGRWINMGNIELNVEKPVLEKDS